MKPSRSQLAVAACLFLLASATCFAADDGPKPAAPKAAAPALDRPALEKALAEKLTGSVLVGHFSIDGKDDVSHAPERYELDTVKKLDGDRWSFVARIKYGKTDVKLPLALTVLWAGDTPMISLTDLTIPGMGTFTARVMFYGDRYAGTWQHGPAGGHMWGKIERPAQPGEKDSKDAKKTD